MRCAASLLSRSAISDRSRSRLRSRSATSCSACRRSAACCSSSAFAPCSCLFELRLRLRHQLALARLDPPELVVQAFLKLLDVARPVRQALFDRTLDLCELLPEPRAGVTFALDDIAAPLLSDPAFLIAQLREGVGAELGEHDFELFGPLLQLLRYDCVEDTFPLLELALQHLLVATDPLQDEGRSEQREDCEERCRDCDDRCGGHALIVGVPRR